MALTSLRQILDHAADNGYGMPAFNVTNLETLLAVMRAAAKTDSPVIVQASQAPGSTPTTCFWLTSFRGQRRDFRLFPSASIKIMVARRLSVGAQWSTAFQA